jgi:hypothetical protein
MPSEPPPGVRCFFDANILYYQSRSGLGNRCRSRPSKRCCFITRGPTCSQPACGGRSRPARVEKSLVCEGWREEWHRDACAGTGECAQSIGSEALAGSSPGTPGLVPPPAKHHSRTIQLDVALKRTATNCNELQRIRASCRFRNFLRISRYASALRKGRNARNACNAFAGPLLMWRAPARRDLRW